MSYLRLLCASAAMAIALALFGPMLWGTAPVLAAGPHMNPNHQMQTGMGPGNNGFFRGDRDHDRDDRFHIQPFPNFRVVRPVIVAPVTVVQPVVSYVPNYSTTTVVVYASAWQSYGPNWTAGMTLSQIAQVCSQYNQAMAIGGTGYNPYVQSVCAGSGGVTVYAPSGAYP